MSTPKFFDAAKNMSGAGFKFSNASAETIASNLKSKRDSSDQMTSGEKIRMSATVILHNNLRGDVLKLSALIQLKSTRGIGIS